MKGWSCTKWVINTTNINDDLVEYTLNGATIATAVFEQSVSSSISQLKSSNNNLTIYPNPTETQINFSATLSGNVITSYSIHYTKLYDGTDGEQLAGKKIFKANVNSKYR